MAAKRRACRPRSNDSKELGRNGGYEGPEESSKSGETAMFAEPKEMPLKQAEQRRPRRMLGPGVRLEKGMNSLFKFLQT